MRVLVAGATGAIGRPLVARLLADGHEVAGTTRSQERAAALREQGATAFVLDAFDAEAVRRAVREAEPEVVVHQLTAFPQEADPKRMREAIDLTARLRRETVPVFAAAAREAGARRIVVQSISFVTKPDGRPVHDETAPLFLDGPREFRGTVEAIRDMEAATVGAEGIGGLVLRYGFYYGPGTWYDARGTIGQMLRKRRYPVIGSGEGRASFVHIDDAVDATVKALDRGAPGIYNITDDQPVAANEWVPEAARLLGARKPFRAPAWLARRLAGEVVVHYNTTLPGNAGGKAIRELGFAPRPWRQGFQEVFA